MSYDAGYAAAVRELKEWKTVARDLAARLEAAKRRHYYCEDSWYSCPLDPDGCADDSAPKNRCNCGADAFNAKIDAALAAYRRLAGEP